MATASFMIETLEQPRAWTAATASKSASGEPAWVRTTKLSAARERSAASSIR
jgi:hypothetical protein